MLSYEVLEYYKFVLDKLDEFEPSIEFLLHWERKYNEMAKDVLTKILSTKLKNSDSNGNAHYIIKDGELISKFTALMKDFKSTFDFFGAFSKYGKMKQDIINYKNEYLIKKDYIEDFFSEIDNIFDLYQGFIQSDDQKEKAIIFGQGVINFKGTFDTCKSTYKNLINLSTNLFEDIEGNKEKIIEIQLLNVEYDLEQFTSNLESINNIYCQIGNMVYKEKTNIGYEKLKIVKIESGSLLSIILGDKNIIEAIGILLNKTINLVFNKYTREGKIYRQNELARTLKETAELGEQLKSLGYDISSSQEDIEKTFAIVTKEMLKIATSSPKIKIDQEIHKMDDYSSTKFLESATTLYLNAGDKENLD